MDPKGRYAIVASRFNAEVTDGLQGTSLSWASGCVPERVETLHAPGAEMPLIAKKLAKTGRYAGVICLAGGSRAIPRILNYFAGRRGGLDASHARHRSTYHLRHLAHLHRRASPGGAPTMPTTKAAKPRGLCGVGGWLAQVAR